MRVNAWAMIIVACAGAAATAQDPAAARQKEVLPAVEAYQGEVARLTSVAVQARVTTGAPYSAEAITESTQMLADGNRIAQKTIARVYRDGEGRTRREQVDAETGTVRSVSISDPVAGATYTLDPANRVAIRGSVFLATPDGIGGAGRGGAVAIALPRSAAPPEQPDAAGAYVSKLKVALEAERAAGGARPVQPAAVPTPATGGGRGRGGPADGSQTTREDLGLQSIEGVQATGNRTTTVIPAGAIGNLQPIRIVSEQWTSSDLKVLVMTKHSDPRTGETVYRLSNIVRAEPDRSLFTVPADYTLKEQPIRRQPQ